jgi:hypothetical protein
MVPLQEEYAREFILLHSLKLWMWKIVYKRTNILNTYQGLMKMVECMEDKGPPCPKGEIGSEVT